MSRRSPRGRPRPPTRQHAIPDREVVAAAILPLLDRQPLGTMGVSRLSRDLNVAKRRIMAGGAYLIRHQYAEAHLGRLRITEHGRAALHATRAV